MRSTLTIDGFDFRGSAVDILAMFNAVHTAAEELNRERGDFTWVPVTGTADNGERSVQVVRLTAASTVNLTVVDDGTMVDEFYDMMLENHKTFMEKARKRSHEDDPSN